MVIEVKGRPPSLSEAYDTGLWVCVVRNVCEDFVVVFDLASDAAAYVWGE